MKKKGIGSEAKAERIANADADLQLLSEAERGRQLQKQKKRRNQGREEEVCYALFALIYIVSVLYLFTFLSSAGIHLFSTLNMIIFTS